jgi:hypothetical protein
VPYLTLFVALCISVVAAWYSIAGLAAIFSAAVIPIIIMGAVLEAGKLVSASWLYQNWNTAPATIRYYLTGAVVVLMFITSMGIFGFLSQAHIKHTSSLSDSSIIIKNLEREIQSEESAITNAQRSIEILDRLVSEANPKDANFIRNTQRRERESLSSTIREASNKIKTLNIELAPLRQQTASLEAEVGPLKYIADFIYGESDQKVLEQAVRWVIIIIVFVFDPLAVMLVIAANMSLKQNRTKLITKKVATVNDFGEWGEETHHSDFDDPIRAKIRQIDKTLDSYYNRDIKKNSDEYKQMRELEKERAMLRKQLKGEINE